MRTPSATDAATFSITRAAASALNVHLLRKPHERARDRHSCRVGACLRVRRRNLLITLSKLHTRDDQLPFFGPKPIQRRLVPPERVAPYHFFERRGRGILVLVGDGVRQRAARHTTHLVAHLVHERLPQVRLKGPFVPWLKGIE